MRLTGWKEEYSIGIDAIDAQHRGLIALVNDLLDALERADGSAAAVADRIIESVNAHFAYEENLLDRCRFPGAAAHAAAHRGLTVEIDRLRADVGRGALTVGPALTGFLLRWLSEHIQGVDREYAAWMHARGLA